MVRMFTIIITKDLRKVTDMLLNVCKSIAANVGHCCQRNRKVYFKISKYDDNPDTFFTVMYDDVLFRYYVALSGGIDRLN